MTATLDAVTNGKKGKPEPTAEQQLAQELVARAKEQGVSLTGPDGLLKQLTKTVLETALNQEMTEHLGHEKHGPAGNETGNVRNGSRAKTVLTEASGQVPIEVPRDRAGTFDPQIVRKRQRPTGKAANAVMSSPASRSIASTFGNWRPSMAAMVASWSRTWAGLGWAKMVRTAAATISAEPLGTCASTLRRKRTRHRCQAPRSARWRWRLSARRGRRR